VVFAPLVVVVVAVPLRAPVPAQGGCRGTAATAAGRAASFRGRGDADRVDLLHGVVRDAGRDVRPRFDPRVRVEPYLKRTLLYLNLLEHLGLAGWGTVSAAPETAGRPEGCTEGQSARREESTPIHV
jgi:hypothetical protein